jgi:hypothetical protein
MFCKKKQNFGAKMAEIAAFSNFLRKLFSGIARAGRAYAVP